MGEVTHRTFVQMHYDLIKHKIPFTFICNGQSMTFYGDTPEIILEVDWKREQFWITQL